MLLSLAVIFSAGIVGLVLAVVRHLRGSSTQPGKNPFAVDRRRAPAPYVDDRSQRDEVLKQRFSANDVPENPDVVVIGSGIGGLTTGLLLARSGLRVLVVEQNGKAGGCCHTFTKKGFEFDTGIHYIGEMRNRTLPKFLIDQLTAGQLVWSDMDDVFDIVLLGKDKVRRYPITAGPQRFVEALVEHFPAERKAIERWDVFGLFYLFFFF